MSLPKLNLCAMGDPTASRTWSGTPSRIWAELQRRQVAGIAFDTSLPAPLRLLLAAASVPLHGSRATGRAPFRRYASALRAARVTAASGTPATLHMGTFALPFAVPPAGQRHYVYCDATWHSWCRHAVDRALYSPRQVALFDRLERRVHEQARHVFAIGEHVREDLVGHYGVPAGKVTVVGTGLGVIAPYHGPKDPAACRVLFAAKERFQEKGGELMVAAFRRAVARDPRLQLTVVGLEAGQDRRVFDGCPNLTVLGFVPLAELQALFESHSLFCLPAVNEAWGLVYLEAMACKMPILGLWRNSFPELSGGGSHGFGVAEADPELLADALVEAFRDPAALAARGERAQAFCLGRYSWERTVDRILSVVSSDEGHD